MKTEWFVANVTALESPETVEYAILGVIFPDTAERAILKVILASFFGQARPYLRSGSHFLRQEPPLEP